MVVALEVAGVALSVVLTHLIRLYVPGIDDYIADVALLLVAYSYGVYRGERPNHRPDLGAR